MGYRILALDGGGGWALIQVRALIALYDNNPDTTGHQVLSDFDLVAANSGGSLVLGGLVENVTLRTLLGYFQDEAKRRSIFSPNRSLTDRLLNRLLGIGPRYSTETKLKSIRGLLPRTGGMTLGQAVAGVRRAGAAEDTHLLIVGFDYDLNRAAFFRSQATGGPRWGDGGSTQVTVAEAIHASTNAPVNYFDEPALLPSCGVRFWDGGITGCNNPVLAAVTEAVTKQQKNTDIVALSLGTGTVILPPASPADPPDSPFVTRPGKAGLLPDVRKLATAILDDPPDAATFIAHAMTGGPNGINAASDSRIVRLNPLVSPLGTPGQWRAPGLPNSPMSPSQFQALANLDMDAVKQEEVAQIDALAALWLADTVRNQPIRRNSQTLAEEIGPGTFSKARAAWESLKNSY
jgi:hypothetical protein